MRAAFNLLLVDHRDSFTWNIVHLLRSLQASVEVVDFEEATLKMLALGKVDGLLLGPGPHGPLDAPQSLGLVRAAARRRLPLLGVCLGHQLLGVAWGGSVRQATRVAHGVVCPVHHCAKGLFSGVANPGNFVRYHSLVLEEPLPKPLRLLARDADGDIAAIVHRALPQWGIQFHPESILSEGGATLLCNFLRLAREQARKRGMR